MTEAASPKNTKILAALDARMIAHSGIGTHIRGLLEGFRELGREKEILLLGTKERLNNTPETKGFPAMIFDAPVYSSAELFKLPVDKLKEKGVHVLHSPHYTMPWFTKGIRRVVTIHDIIQLTHSPQIGFAKKAAAKQVIKHVRRRADRVFSVSKYTAQQLEKKFGFKASEIIITPNAPAAVFRRPVTQTEIMQIRPDMGIKPDVYFLTVGINKPHKNFEFIVKVMAGLWAGKKTDAALVMAGIPPEESDPFYKIVRAKAGPEAERRLIFPGRVPQSKLPALYKRAAALIVPSLEEGFCLPVVEAQSVGTPVACAQASCLPEVAGDGALFFDPNETEYTGVSLMRLLNEKRFAEVLRERGKANADRYHWRSTAEIILDTYEKVKNLD